MIRVEFSEDVIKSLEYDRYHHPSPKVQKRMEVMYLKSQGMAHHDICRICRISKTTMAKYLRLYQEGGIDGLKRLNYKGKPNELLNHKDTLEAYFREHPPHTTAQAQAIIEELTGIKRSPTQVRVFMKRIGMTCRKVGFVPGRAMDPGKQIEQEEFRQQQLEPRLAEAEKGERDVLFMDAAHFVHGTFLGMLWCFIRIFIPSPSGRKRFNVLGALHAVSKEVLTITNETYIDAQCVCRLLLQIAQYYGTRPITVVLDNARYQKCALVQGFAAQLGIELLFLPSYSPQLNLIERYWRFVKNKCLYSKYYSDFGQFKTAITQCIQLAVSDHGEELESLLTWNFQSFRKVHILPI